MSNFNVSIFCASGTSGDKNLVFQVKELSKALTEQNYNLVYGGSSKGLMGLVASTFLENKRKVIGVLPESMAIKGIMNEECTTTIITKNMHERKGKMYELSDAFIILPGGIGTMEEFFEIYTWRQLGYHNKNIALFNVNHFYDGIISYLDNAVKNNFLKPEVREAIIVESDKNELIRKLKLPPSPLPDKLRG